jgi:hypothetical protein
MGFNPYNRALKIWESIWDSNSYNGSPLGSVKVHSLTLLAFPGACEVTPGLPSWSTTLQPPCLGCEPKVRVATFYIVCQLGQTSMTFERFGTPTTIFFSLMW